MRIIIMVLPMAKRTFVFYCRCAKTLFHIIGMIPGMVKIGILIKDPAGYYIYRIVQADAQFFFQRQREFFYGRNCCPLPCSAAPLRPCLKI